MPIRNLLELPPELILAIFTFLRVPDILRCHRLCRLTNNLIVNSVEIQYTIELYCSSQRENDHPPPIKQSISDRLALLRTVNDNWRNLNFVRHSALSYPLPSSYVYELSGGRLVLGYGSDDTDGRNGTTGLNFYDLPGRNESAGKGKVEQRIVVLDFPIADFALDVSQNLLILLERTANFGINIHIRTFDTNIPHPDAKETILFMPNQKWVTVHVSGPTLACLFADSSTDVLAVWDWKTGERIGTVPGAKLKSFVLLSPRDICIANLDQDSLDVYHINTKAKYIMLVQRLLLPRVTGDQDATPWAYDSALLRSHPNPRDFLQPSSIDPTTRQAHLPFMTDESDGIIACTFHSTSELNNFTLVTHRSSLLRVYNEDVPPRETNRNGVRGRERLVPWSDWGPDNVRWINIECSMRWICYVHGHRLAVLEQKPLKRNDGRFEVTSDEEEKISRSKLWPMIRRRLARSLGKQTDDDQDLLQEEEEFFDVADPSKFYALRVFDFNPNHVRQAAADDSVERISPDTPVRNRVNRGRLLVRETTLTKGKIQTRLPYLDTTVKLRKIGLRERKRQIEGVMMNGECIIVMMADRHFRTDGVEVLNV